MSSLLSELFLTSPLSIRLAAVAVPPAANSNTKATTTAVLRMSSSLGGVAGKPQPWKYYTFAAQVRIATRVGGAVTTTHRSLMIRLRRAISEFARRYGAPGRAASPGTGEAL